MDEGLPRNLVFTLPIEPISLVVFNHVVDGPKELSTKEGKLFGESYHRLTTGNMKGKENRFSFLFSFL